MNRFRPTRYALFQLTGWGLFALVNLFFAFIFDQLTWNNILRLLFFVEVGVLLSHLMREVIHRSALLLKGLQQQIIIFIILTCVFTLGFALLQTLYEQLYNLRGSGKRMP